IGSAATFAAAMLALIDASCVTAARETSGSLLGAALAFLAAMTMSIASRIVSVFNRLASSNARMRLSLSHNAACPSPSIVFVSSCPSVAAQASNRLTPPPDLASAALSPLTAGHCRETPLHYFGYQPFRVRETVARDGRHAPSSARYGRRSAAGSAAIRSGCPRW